MQPCVWRNGNDLMSFPIVIVSCVNCFYQSNGFSENAVPEIRFYSMPFQQ